MRPTPDPAADTPNEADRARTLAHLVHDRTAELTAAAHRLENEHALLEDVVRQMPNGVLVVDAVTRRPSIGNNALESLIGVAPEEIDTDHPALAPLRRTLKTGDAVKAEQVEVVQPGGRSRRLEVNSAPIYNASRELIAAVATFDDLDARERRDRAQRDFVANAAHGLQNPLAVISTAVEILQSGAKDDPDERDRFLAHIERETARLTRLTRALLRLARVESGAEPVRKKVVELHPLLVRLAGRLRPLSRVPVEVDCPSDLALVTNAELLEEALVNLGENSAKYTERGSIRLVAEPVGDDLARVSVHDTGPGIPEEEWERVFERFARGHPSGGEGFGIGLALVGQIAAALDAELEVGSNDGKGSSFSLVVPAMRMVPA
jgi:two-component system, OmpR family, phosphate regulon sensor histidine kinase PhoR